VVEAPLHKMGEGNGPVLSDPGKDEIPQAVT
jgi:hypothetical protein